MPPVGLDEQSHTYTHPITGEVLPSNTTILDRVQDTPWLAPWMSKLTLTAALNNLERVAGLLAAGRAEEARKLVRDEAAMARELAARIGSYEHDVYEKLLLDQRLPDLPDDLNGQVTSDGDVVCQQYVDAIADGWLQFVADFGIRTSEVEAAEMTVCDPVLGWAGTLDTNLRFMDLDWKTGKRKSVTWPAQVSAYGEASEAWPVLGIVKPKPRPERVGVLHLRAPWQVGGYARGYKLILFSDAERAAGYQHFLTALAAFRSSEDLPKQFGTAWYPPLEDGSQPLPMLEDITGYCGAPGALRRAGLGPDATLDAVAEFTAQELLQASGIGPKRLEAIGQMLADHGLTLAQTLTAAGTPAIADTLAGVA